MAKISQNLRPFQVPNFVTIEMPPRPRECGMSPSPTVAIGDLPAETLAELCDDFRAAVFAKAGKPDPRSPGSNASS